MPVLAAPLNFAKLEAQNIRIHNTNPAPSAPVTGQLYYDNTSSPGTLYYYNGSAWVAAGAGAAPPDATTSTKGMVQLAGDLAGTAASPQIAAGVITDVDVATANKDGAVGTASMRTLGAGAQQAAPGNRTLDADPAPVASLNLNNQRIISLADPTGATDGANKQYVDGVAAGLSWKKPVRVASTVNIGASPPSGAQTVDGVAVSTSDLVLLTAQTVPADNGIWAANTGGTWVRPTSADTQAELLNAAVFVSEGTANADTAWVCTTNAPITVGTTALTWVQFSGAAQIISGAGLTKTGNTLDVGGTANRITVGADTVDISTAYVGQATITTLGTITTGVWNGTAVPVANGGTGSSTAGAARTALSAAGYYNNAATHGAGTTITITAATHGLRASRGLLVQCQDNATGNVEIPDVSVAANGDVTITYAVSVTANTKLITIIG